MTLTGMIETEVEVPKGVQVKVEGNTISVTGSKGNQIRQFDLRRINVVQGASGKFVVKCEYPRIRDKAMVGTIASHIRNMVHGVMNGFEYRMKIVYSHFPIKATVKGNEFIVENFLGERHPRKTHIVGDVKVQVKKDEVIITGISIEEAGQTAANIEQATKVRGLDIRVFQDGIYITQKGRRDAT